MHARLPFALSAALLCVAVSSPASAQAHAHPTAGYVPASAAQPASQRHATDAPLREGMQGIRAAVDALGHYEHGHMGPEQAALLAGRIQGHVNDIIANCRLEPEADAALHAIIVPLTTHAAALKADPSKLDEIPPMRQALGEYAARFDDPGFAQAGEPEEAR